MPLHGREDAWSEGKMGKQNPLFSIEGFILSTNEFS